MSCHSLSLLFRLHRSLQYLTCSQHLSHFFLQVKDFLQIAQTFVGLFSFFNALTEHKHFQGFNCFITMETHEVDRVIEMAWEDRTPFDAIAFQFGLSEKEVIVLMRTHLKPSSWRRWRKRVQGRGTKHQAKRAFTVGRHRCSRQRSISNNKVT